mgnify:CR=1 FL=1
MRVIDLINSNEKTAFSFEILPPLKGTGIEKLYQTIDTLREFDPKYINITTHRSEYVYKDLGNGLFQRNRLRRRPGTVAVAAAIQNKYNITMVPHILCSGFTREETEYVLLDLQFLGITDLLVLRGDKAKHESSFIPVGNGYHHAVELQEQINNFNKGIFVDGSEMKVTNTPFSYGVACYPEKHYEKLRQAWQRMQSIRNYAESGGRVLAECGGMIYLSKGILLDRSEHSDSEVGLQAGVLPFFISNRKADRRLTLGYRQFDYNGQHLRGHEFHYTQFEPKPEESLESVTQVYNAKRMPVSTPVFRYKNVIASYTHLYWGEIDLLKLFE